MIAPDLPGSDLINSGIRALDRRETTVESLLVSMASERLASLGILTPEPLPDPEMSLYRLLVAAHGDAAHGRYNALVRRLVSFHRAAACAK